MINKKLSVLIVDDEEEYQTVLSLILKREGYQTICASSVEQAIDKLSQRPVDVIVSDLIMGEKSGLDLLKMVHRHYPAIEFILITGYGSYATAVEAIKEGAFSYFAKGSDPDELIRELEKLSDLKAIKKEQSLLTEGPLLRSNNRTIQEIFKTLDKISQTDITVLLSGESGVGKEIFARYIHDHSQRSNKRYVSVNCSSLSKNLLESELFGYEKGAFTGADDTYIGRFEYADNGTLFLDEIGEIDLETQVKLLRVLETQVIERVGSKIPIKLNNRLVSATNKDLSNEIKNKHFREDLYYRLNAISIEIPPLRRRREDISMFVDHFVNYFKHKYNKQITGADNQVAVFFNTYDFPGNIRELRNIVERLVVLSESDKLSEKDLPSFDFSLQETNSELSVLTTEHTLKTLRQEVEKKYIIKLLETYNGDLTKVSTHLGITRRHLLNLVKDLAIKY